MPVPCHPRVRDSLGRLRTLATGPESFEFLTWSPAGGAADSPTARENATLVLGLGPCPPDAVRRVKENTGGVPEESAPSRRLVAWVECPEFDRALAEAGVSPPPPPPHWVRLTPDEAVAFAAEMRPAVWTYRQSRRLYPDFWGPLFARLEAEAPAAAPGPRPVSRTVLLPGGPRDLLHLELWDALHAEGYAPVSPPAAERRRGLPLARLLEAERPAFCLSVNLRGLDAAGETFHLLEAMGVPVALWFVDNPWHILSALRLPWWKKAALFVTDATFIPGLRRHGADWVYSLPLAASPLFRPRGEPVLPRGTRVLFVGRSSFPGRDAFFGAAHPSDELLRQADELLRQADDRPRRTEALPEGGGRPDFHWWTEKSGLSELWPGHAVRAAGAGAEASSLRHRALWLDKLAPAGLTVVGDKGWKALLPPGPPEPLLLPPVDYYTVLPGLYRAAPFTFNATSLLLPGGLTQRHFDVWQAGGFLLTTRTAGLDIFPCELVRAVTLDAETPVADCVNSLESRPALRREIQDGWQKVLGESHTYRHRIRFLSECLVGSLDERPTTL